MNWKMPRRPRTPPKTGRYSEWKQEIAADCHNQCIYCCIPDSRYGGIDNFHVEHYRPKSLFGDLENSIGNLYLACAICNRFKSDDWPNEPLPDHSAASYPDPHTCDYSTLFSVESGSFSIAGLYVASRYLVERLYLNRPQLLRERRHAQLLNELTLLKEWFNLHIKLLKDSTDIQLLRDTLAYSKKLADALAFDAEALRAVQYDRAEIRRPN